MNINKIVVNYMNDLRARERGVSPNSFEDSCFVEAGFERVAGTNVYVREAKVGSFDASFSMVKVTRNRKSITGKTYILTHFNKDLERSPDFLESDGHGMSDFIADIIKEADGYQGL